MAYLHQLAVSSSCAYGCFLLPAPTSFDRMCSFIIQLHTYGQVRNIALACVEWFPHCLVISLHSHCIVPHSRVVYVQLADKSTITVDHTICLLVGSARQLLVCVCVCVIQLCLEHSSTPQVILRRSLSLYFLS